MQEKSITFLSVLLVLVGVAEPAGFLVGNRTLREMGRLSSASSLPLVFNDVGGVAFWANHYTFEFTDRTGGVEWLEITSEVRSRIRGPHTRTAAYVVPIGLGPVLGPTSYRDPLRYGLCDNGPLARDLGYERDLREAKIHIRGHSRGRVRKWVLRVSCET